MSKGNKILVGVLWSLAATSVVLSMFVAAVVFGRPLEMKFNPVMGEGRIISATPLDGAQTSIEFEAEKLRDCDWQKTTWFIGEYGGRAAFVQSRHVDAPKLRGIGKHHWKSIIVSLPAEMITSGSYAITEHTCHPFWQSQSLFYLGNGKAAYAD